MKRHFTKEDNSVTEPQSQHDVSNEEELEVAFRAFINDRKLQLQLHALRYEGLERTSDQFVKSSIALNGGALLIVLTTEGIRQSGYDLTFALWFITGCVVCFFGLFARYLAKLIILNTPAAYFRFKSDGNKLPRTASKWAMRLGLAAVALFFLSIVAFAWGCIQAFLTMGSWH